jgi:hypothetical protein
MYCEVIVSDNYQARLVIDRLQVLVEKSNDLRNDNEIMKLVKRKP